MSAPATTAPIGPGARAASCGRCGGPVLETWSAATGVPLLLDPDLIETVAVRHREEIRSTAAAVGYRLMADGSAVVACAPGPAGYAGAGDSYDVHRCAADGRSRLRLVAGGGVRSAA